MKLQGHWIRRFKYAPIADGDAQDRAEASNMRMQNLMSAVRAAGFAMGPSEDGSESAAVVTTTPPSELATRFARISERGSSWIVRPVADGKAALLRGWAVHRWNGRAPA